MPLHDWRDDRGFSSLHLVWQNELLYWLQPRLPEGYRAYLGAVPAITLDAPLVSPDVVVVPHGDEPDVEAVAVFDLDPQLAVHIDRHGRLIAAIEIVSPRNKDRPDARERYLGRYVGYVRRGVHLMLIDVLPRPAGFSFADGLEANIGFRQSPCPTPFVCSYRVGEPVPEGTIVGVWHRPMAIGEPLPTLPLALTTTNSVSVNLEHTYSEAARRVYLT